MCSSLPALTKYRCGMRKADDMLKSCKSSQHLKQIHAHVLKTNSTHNPFSVISQLLLTCAACFPPPNISYSLSLFNLLQPSTNTFVWNTMIRVFTHSNFPTQALSLYVKMRRMDIPHDSFSLTFTLKACSCHQSLPHGEQIHTQVVKTSYSAQAHVHSALMHMYVECRRPQSARKLFDEIPVKSPAAWCVMITLYAEMGELDSCRVLFEEMPHRDLASWNAMIDACGRCGQPDEALRLFREMMATALRPNHITMLGVISACGEMGDVEFGRWIHANYIDNNAFKCNSLRVSTTLIDMYSKCGHVNLAMDVFRSINGKDVLSWTAIICCMAINGRGDTALALFNEMVKAGVRPDEVTFIVVLCACSHTGLVEEGRQYFESMTKDYGLVPRIEHYGCMVDIMGRAGHIEQVRKFIENMPMEPNVVVLRSLLAACRVHSAMQMAEWAAKRLEAVRRARDDDSCVMLSNVYAEDGRWREVERVRRLMKELGRSKRWGCSSLHACVDN